MKHLLEQMTFLEFQERMAEDPVIILTLGSVEVQGPCNPMGDFMLAERIASIVAEKSGAIAAPCMPFGYAEVFRGVPGGMQVRADTFRAVVRDMIGAFMDHGMQRVVILNGHTGNNALLEQTTHEIRRETGVIIPWINIWPTGSLANKQAHGDNAPRSTGHGSDPIGSVYEYFYPELTRRDAARPPEAVKTLLGLPTGGLNSLRIGNVPVGAPVAMLDHCDATVGGDPSLANAGSGKVFADFIIDACVTLVEHMKTATVRDPLA
ncbi:creatininase family protein [Acidisphaera sp. L21]|uniref:creatininase family protein n=1 Tax=Acidisphaera sp. L21 TaxID=1641851 RepID=UPI00131B50A1|nr:creatininase family protein [Acidisphaera sp. L21]